MKFQTQLFLLLLPFFIFSEGPSVEDIKKLEELKTGQEISENIDFIEVQTGTIREEDACLLEEKCIYGYDFFNKSPTTFALSSDVPIPPNYLLGPGDEIKIDFYGQENITRRIIIDRSGIISLPRLGPVNLAGITLNKAQKLIENRVSSELIGTNVLVSLGSLRSINVYLLGEAYKPGTYTVSALSTVTNVMFASGGVSKIGSLRNIQIKRNGKVKATYDFYDLLFKGDTSQDMRLQDGDTIFIPLIQARVAINGSVLREGYFETKNNETIKDLISLSGLERREQNILEYNSFSDDRQTRISKVLGLSESGDINLKDGDVVNILRDISANIKTITLQGQFRFPGVYSIENQDRLLDVINKAGGLTEDAYPEAAIFTRSAIARIEKNSYIKNADNIEKSLLNAVTEGAEIEGVAYQEIISLIEKLRSFEPIGRQVVTIDPLLLKSDPKLNFKIQDSDVLIVPKRTSSISVVGEVLNPITHIYNQDLSISDYIKLSGGLSEGADNNKIFIINPNGQARLFQKRLFGENLSSNLLPGSTIVVGRDTQPFDWLKLTAVITPILSDLAVSAAAIAAISDNN